MRIFQGMRRLSHEELIKRQYTPEDLSRLKRLPISVLLENVRSLYNVGSVFRTADGARLEKLYLCGYTPAPPRREIEKTALGATQSVPWEHHRDPRAALRDLRARGVRICALEHTDASVPYDSLTPDHFPVCLLVGNEITGVSPALLEEADLALEIPMYGMKQSLNLAVACGIAIYGLLRIWHSGAGSGTAFMAR